MPPASTAGLDFVRYILETIVEEQDKLIVEQSVDDLGTLITIQVGSKDMGKLIGKNGQTVKALRTLVRVLGGTRSERINLKILEPSTPPPSP